MAGRVLYQGKYITMDAFKTIQKSLSNVAYINPHTGEITYTTTGEASRNDNLSSYISENKTQTTTTGTGGGDDGNTDVDGGSESDTGDDIDGGDI